MLLMCALTVFGETDSWTAISGRDRLVGLDYRARLVPSQQCNVTYYCRDSLSESG